MCPSPRRRRVVRPSLATFLLLFVPRASNMELTGLARNPGQLQGPYRDFESNCCWVDLQTLGPPCEFHLFITRSGRDVDPAPAAAGCSLQRRGQPRRFMLACMGEDGMLVARLYIVCHPQPASSIQTSSGRGVLAAPPSTTLLAMMVARGA